MADGKDKSQSDSKSDSKSDLKSEPSGPTKEQFEALQSETEKLREAHAQAQQELATAKGYLQSLVEQYKSTAEEPEFSEKLNDDPEKAIEDMVAARVAPMVNSMLESSAETARRVAAAEHGNNWTRHEKEINDFMSRMPADVKARPESWAAAYKYVQLNHVDEIVDEKLKEKLEREQKSSLEVSSPGVSPREPRKGLNDEERRIAEALEVSEEDYVAMRDSMIADPVRGRAALSGPPKEKKS